MSTLGRFGLLALALTFALVAAHPALTNGGDNGGGTRSLTGEDLFANDVSVDADCDPDGVSTVEYSASGLATPPYPGPFFVYGRATIGPQEFEGARPGTVAGPLLGLNEVFIVFSPLGRVTGTKTLPPNAVFDTSFGTCMQVSNGPILDFVDGTGSVVEISTQPRYEATIREPGGTFRDRGDALLSWTEIDASGSCPTGTCQVQVAGFDQFFLQSDPAPPPDDDDDDDDD